MATYRSNGAGNYVDDSGQTLYDSFKQDAGGRFVNSAGNSLYGGAPVSPYGGGSASQRSMAYAASQPAASPASLAQQLRQQYADSMKAANEANDLRYGEALGLNADLRLRQLGGVDPVTGEKKLGAYETYGADQKLQIQQAAQNAAGDINQAAVDRGIFNSSASLNRLASAGAAAGVGIAGVEQDKLRLKNAADSQLTNDRIGLIQSKVDQQPDLNQLIQLEQMSGSGSTDGMYGGGVYGGGGGGGGFNQYNPFINAGQMGYSMPGSYNVYGGGGGGEKSDKAVAQDAARAFANEAKRKGFGSVSQMMDAQRSSAAIDARAQRNAGAMQGSVYGAYSNAIGSAMRPLSNMWGAARQPFGTPSRPQAANRPAFNSGGGLYGARMY